MAAGNADSQIQLLTLIRDFEWENWNGEGRLDALRRHIEDYPKHLKAASAGLEDLKRQKEKLEQEVKGCEVELAMNDASIQTFEKRIAKIEDDISAVGSYIDELKNVEEALREGFERRMVMKNAEIRKLLEIRGSALKINDQSCLSSNDEFKQAREAENELNATIIQEQLGQLLSKLKIELEQYQAEQSIYKEVQQELTDVKKKLSLMEGVTETTEELEELAKQTVDVEEACASLGEELQKKSERPNCQQDNLEAIQEFLHGIYPHKG